MQDYRKLLVWQKSHRLALTTYELPAYLIETRGLAAARSDSSRRDLDSIKHRGRRGTRI